jgi:hypothetical protein
MAFCIRSKVMLFQTCLAVKFTVLSTGTLPLRISRPTCRRTSRGQINLPRFPGTLWYSGTASTRQKQPKKMQCGAGQTPTKRAHVQWGQRTSSDTASGSLITVPTPSHGLDSPSYRRQSSSPIMILTSCPKLKNATYGGSNAGHTEIRVTEQRRNPLRDALGTSSRVWSCVCVARESESDGTHVALTFF